MQGTAVDLRTCVDRVSGPGGTLSCCCTSATPKKSGVNYKGIFGSALGIGAGPLEAKLSQLDPRHRRGIGGKSKGNTQSSMGALDDTFKNTRQQAKSLLSSLEIARGHSTWNMHEESQAEPSEPLDSPDIPMIPLARRKLASSYIPVHQRKLKTSPENKVLFEDAIYQGSSCSSSSDGSDTSDDDEVDSSWHECIDETEECDNDENKDNIPLLWEMQSIDTVEQSDTPKSPDIPESINVLQRNSMDPAVCSTLPCHERDTSEKNSMNDVTTCSVPLSADLLADSSRDDDDPFTMLVQSRTPPVP